MYICCTYLYIFGKENYENLHKVANLIWWGGILHSADKNIKIDAKKTNKISNLISDHNLMIKLKTFQ